MFAQLTNALWHIDAVLWGPSTPSNKITETLQSEIENGTLSPGTILKQERLAERFGVSRQPVRQALERLLANGLLTKRSDRSLAVNGLSANEAHELSQIRISLESTALILSIPHLTQRDLRKGICLNEELFEEEDPAIIEELDIAFHRTLYAPCGNGRLLQMIGELRGEARRSYHQQPAGSQARKAFYEEHNGLLAVCSLGDVNKAVEIIEKHIGITSRQLVVHPESGAPQ